ncbi:MAG: ankyrin repeat domain-containing protein, partial [Alphaproteobacteria bacterium]
MALSAMLHLSFVLPFIIIALPILRFATETPPEEAAQRMEEEAQDVMMVDVLVFSESDPEVLPPSRFLGIEGERQTPEFNQPLKDTSEKIVERKTPDTEKPDAETAEKEPPKTETREAEAEKTKPLEELKEVKEGKVAEIQEKERVETEPVEEKKEVKEEEEEIKSETAEVEVPEVEPVEERKEVKEETEIAAETKRAEVKKVEKVKPVEEQKEIAEAVAAASERVQPESQESPASPPPSVTERLEPTPEQEALPKGQPKAPTAESQEATSRQEALARDEKDAKAQATALAPKRPEGAPEKREKQEAPPQPVEESAVPAEAVASIPVPVAAGSSKPSLPGEEIARLLEAQEAPTSPEAAAARPGQAATAEGRLGELLQGMRERNRRLDRSLQEPPEEEMGERRIQSILRLQDAAEQGYAHAQHGLAEILMKGSAKERVPEEAKRLLTSAARAGYVEAQVLLGYLAASDKNQKKNFPEALAWLKLAAQRGNKAAIYGAEKLEKLMEVKDVIEAHKLAQKYRSYIPPKAPAPIIGGVQDLREPDEILREASAAGDMETVQLMLARGADPNALDETGRSALINAAWRGRRKIVQLLLEKGADLTILDRDGMSAVNWAAVNGHGEVIHMLAGDGANLN